MRDAESRDCSTRATPLALALRLAFGHPRPEDGARGLVARVRRCVARAAGAARVEPVGALHPAPRRPRDRRDVAARRHCGAHSRRPPAGARAGRDHGARCRGVDAVVLKGLPLGHRLYGDPFVRCMSDIDLHVPGEQRSARSGDAPSTRMAERGWSGPWHECWASVADGSEYHLELHSWLVSDHLAHLPAPPPLSAREEIAGVELPVQAGDFVAPYLAAHLATHQLPPLLWLVDFATLWATMSEAARGRARDAAHACGSRPVRCVGRRASHAGRARRRGRLAGVRRAGHRARGRRDTHSIWRHVALAASHRWTGSVSSGRSWCRGECAATSARSRSIRWRGFAGGSGLWSVRHARTQRRRDAERQDGAGTPDVRPLRWTATEMVEPNARRRGRAARRCSVRAPGGSMLPTIPRGALVRIGAVAERRRDRWGCRARADRRRRAGAASRDRGEATTASSCEAMRPSTSIRRCRWRGSSALRRTSGPTAKTGRWGVARCVP